MFVKIMRYVVIAFALSIALYHERSDVNGMRAIRGVSAVPPPGTTETPSQQAERKAADAKAALLIRIQLESATLDVHDMHTLYWAVKTLKENGPALQDTIRYRLGLYKTANDILLDDDILNRRPGRGNVDFYVRMCLEIFTKLPYPVGSVWPDQILWHLKKEQHIPRMWTTVEDVTNAECKRCQMVTDPCIMQNHLGRGIAGTMQISPGYYEIRIRMRFDLHKFEIINDLYAEVRLNIDPINYSRGFRQEILSDLKTLQVDGQREGWFKVRFHVIKVDIETQQPLKWKIKARYITGLVIDFVELRLTNEYGESKNRLALAYPVPVPDSKILVDGAGDKLVYYTFRRHA